MLTVFSDPQVWFALLSLTALEIVLGIDNIVFIAIVAGRLPPNDQPKAYRLGLLGALVTRVLLLFTLSWIMRLSTPFMHLFSHPISGRDLILILGGLFLIAKSTVEIYSKVEGVDSVHQKNVHTTLGWSVVQIMLLDIIFSLDSVITAVGMVSQLWIMVTAVIIAILVMLIFAQSIGDFVHKHPSIKVLALAFLLLIGVLLMADGLGQHLDKGYIYFAMGFSLLIEMLNMRLRKKHPTPTQT